MFSGRRRAICGKCWGKKIEGCKDLVQIVGYAYAAADLRRTVSEVQKVLSRK
jgi:hypothetical protein